MRGPPQRGNASRNTGKRVSTARTLSLIHIFVTRDAREVERKKVGLRKARRRKQFSKR